MKMILPFVLFATALIFSVVTIPSCDAGVFTYMAASGAESAARRAEDAAKSSNTPVTITTNKSTICKLDNSGFCDISLDTPNQLAERLAAWYHTRYKATPEQFATIYEGYKIHIISITYTYMGDLRAIIEYERSQ